MSKDNPGGTGAEETGAEETGAEETGAEETGAEETAIDDNAVICISQRLGIVALVWLALAVALFVPAYYWSWRFPLSWFCFLCGSIGGVVSLEQRLKTIPDDEIRILSKSWVLVLTGPIFGGIFSLVLYLFFLGKVIEGSLFPDIAVPQFCDPPTTHDMTRLLRETIPATGADFAKLGIWTFAAGFSERLVPDIMKGKLGLGRGRRSS